MLRKSDFVLNQCTVSGRNFSKVLTYDPAVDEAKRFVGNNHPEHADRSKSDYQPTLPFLVQQSASYKGLAARYVQTTSGQIILPDQPSTTITSLKQRNVCDSVPRVESIHSSSP